MVKAVVIDVDVEKERISLSIKQLGGDPFAEAIAGVKRRHRHRHRHRDRGRRHRGRVRRDEVLHPPVGPAAATAPSSAPSASPWATTSTPRSPTSSKTRRLGLSIKAREIAEEKEAIEQYGSSDSGASLGDILGAALKRRDNV